MTGDETPRRQAVWIVVPVAVVMALFVLLLATRESGVDRGLDDRLAGDLAPLIVATTIDGVAFDLDDQRGRFVVVNFFSTTCVPCIIEHPELVAFYETHEPTDFATVVSIAFDDSDANVRAFFDENGGDWPIITENTGSFAVKFGVALVPESIIVADSGEVIAKLFGGVTQGTIEQVILEYLEARDEAA